MNVRQKFKAVLLTHFAQHLQTLLQSGAPIRMHRSAVGFIKRSLKVNLYIKFLLYPNQLARHLVQQISGFNHTRTGYKYRGHDNLF